MAVHDPIANMLTKIRNAFIAKHERVDVLSSKEKLEIVRILRDEGYIKNFRTESSGVKTTVKIILKYDESGVSVLEGLKRISKPGRRVYRGYRNMIRLYNGMGTVIVSTSKGVVTGRDAKAAQVGGEILCAVW